MLPSSALCRARLAGGGPLAERRASGQQAGPSSSRTALPDSAQRRCRCRASQQEQQSKPSSSSSSELLDAIEQKEKAKEKEKGAKAERDAFSVPDAEPARPPPPPPPKKRRAAADPQGGPAEWREGQLLPEGWERLNVFQKAYELYAGKRGLLFWVNKIAYAAVFVVLFAWVVFRFVLPALGLYQLENDLLSPPQQ